MAAAADKKPSGHEHMVVIDDDVDGGYIDPMTIRSIDDEDDQDGLKTGVPTTGQQQLVPGQEQLLPSYDHSMVNNSVNGANGQSVNIPQIDGSRYIVHHSKSYRYTQNALNWIHERIKCLLNWIISISAIVSMILKLPFFVFLIAVLLDLVKQRLKAKAAAAERATDTVHKPYEEEIPTNGQGSNPAQSSKGLMIEALIFIILLVAVILLQFLVFITHTFQSANCCTGSDCCNSSSCGHRKKKRQRTRNSILAVYFFPLTLWILVFISSYFLNEWPHFGGGILMMFKLLIHGNSLTGTPDMYQVTLMKYSFSGDVISFMALITYFVLGLITCIKHRGDDHSDSNKELTGRGTTNSSCSSPSCHGSSSSPSPHERRSKSDLSKRHNYPKASTMKWYTINCGCFTLFDPRVKDGARPLTPVDKKMAMANGYSSDENSDCHRGTPSNCSECDEEETCTCDDGDVRVQSVQNKSSGYIQVGTIVDGDVNERLPLTVTVVQASAPSENVHAKLLTTDII